MIRISKIIFIASLAVSGIAQGQPVIDSPCADLRLGAQDDEYGVIHTSDPDLFVIYRDYGWRLKRDPNKTPRPDEHFHLASRVALYRQSDCSVVTLLPVPPDAKIHDGNYYGADYVGVLEEDGRLVGVDYIFSAPFDNTATATLRHVKLNDEYEVVEVEDLQIEWRWEYPTTRAHPSGQYYIGRGDAGEIYHRSGDGTGFRADVSNRLRSDICRGMVRDGFACPFRDRDLVMFLDTSAAAARYVQMRNVTVDPTYVFFRSEHALLTPLGVQVAEGERLFGKSYYAPALDALVAVTEPGADPEVLLENFSSIRDAYLRGDRWGTALPDADVPDHLKIKFEEYAKGEWRSAPKLIREVSAKDLVSMGLAERLPDGVEAPQPVTEQEASTQATPVTSPAPAEESTREVQPSPMTTDPARADKQWEAPVVDEKPSSETNWLAIVGVLIVLFAIVGIAIRRRGHRG